MKKSRGITLLILLFASTTPFASNCIDPLDTYNTYDNNVKEEDINNIRSEYYVLSYSWAPGHCADADKKSKKPGKKNYLQCGSGRTFGYILHGLWPQGLKSGEGGYPRACEGDQPKIKRETLDKYLCMTPSRWLLQHEYEFHATCMHDETLETPEAYFSKALELHSKIEMPTKRLPNNSQSIEWFTTNNPDIKAHSIQYWSGGKEWQFCIDNEFQFMKCPSNTSNNTSEPVTGDCVIKGNISGNSGNKYYFTSAHPNYDSVKIDPAKGEKCFATQEEARNAGWSKAP